MDCRILLPLCGRLWHVHPDFRKYYRDALVSLYAGHGAYHKGRSRMTYNTGTSHAPSYEDDPNAVKLHGRCKQNSLQFQRNWRCSKYPTQFERRLIRTASLRPKLEIHVFAKDRLLGVHRIG